MIRKLVIAVLSIGLGLNGVVFNTLKNSCVAIDPNKKRSLALAIIEQDFYKKFKADAFEEMVNIQIAQDIPDERLEAWVFDIPINAVTYDSAMYARKVWWRVKLVVREMHHMLRNLLVKPHEKDFMRMLPDHKTIEDGMDALHDYYSKEDTGDNTAAKNLLGLFINLGLDLDDDCWDKMSLCIDMEIALKSFNFGTYDTENRKLSIYENICKVYEIFNNNLKDFINSYNRLDDAEKKELLDDLALVEALESEDEMENYVKNSGPDVDFIKCIISLDK